MLPPGTITSSSPILLCPPRRRNSLAQAPLLSSLNRRRPLLLLLRPMNRIAASASSPRTPPLSFPTPESLSEFLTPRLPSDSLASWGVSPGTKNLHSLWLEISHGETSLHDAPHPLVRTVHVASVRIRNARGAYLVESRQLLSDGTLRQRGRPLSEKMLPNESVDAAAQRAVREELGADGARVVPGSYEVRVVDRVSASYPGLPARYVLHTVSAEVEGLPEDGEFSTPEAGEGVEEKAENAIFVTRHFWNWVENDGFMDILLKAKGRVSEALLRFQDHINRLVEGEETVVRWYGTTSPVIGRGTNSTDSPSIDSPGLGGTPYIVLLAWALLWFRNFFCVDF